jgi:hypothetical protein
MAHTRMMMGDTQAALDAQQAMMDGQVPTAADAMLMSGGLSGQAAEALVGNQPGFSSNVVTGAEAPAAMSQPQIPQGGMG